VNQKKLRYYLIGMPGIGKSYAISQFENQSKIECIDLDTSIESSYHLTVPQIIHDKGIEFFRLYEAITLRKLNKLTNTTLVACGGGTPCFHDNISWINRSGISIYLHGSPEYLLQNYTQHQIKRPLSNDKDLDQYISKLYHYRIEYYQQAHFTIDVEKNSDNIKNIINNIIVDNSANNG